MTSAILKYTGKDLVRVYEGGHEWSKICPVCNEDCSGTGINKLVWSSEICKCDVAKYNHLVEQLWHRKCFIKEGGKTPYAQGEF